MKIAYIFVRTLLGLLLLFASLTYFIIHPEPEHTGAMKLFTDGLKAAVYIMPIVKTIELFVGLAFVSGRYVSLATVVIAPIVVNIVGVHIFLEPTGLPIALGVLAATLFVAYYNRENYRSLFVAR
ncbi:MAG: DoxX family protein [Leptospiraceae bacterium]|nr:DoxX family protein [Leptospiraceae bacterium]